jgi:apolipoprotein D and lipocalin family protein
MNLGKKFDVNKYLGTWYEIAKKPFFWEDPSGYNVKAEYKLTKLGTISVHNSYIVNGKLKNAYGDAVIINDDEPYKLSVTFFLPSDEPNYWIYWTDYNVAIVSDSKKSNIWILARNKQISKEQMKFCFDYIRNKLNYNGILTITKQI